MTKLAAQSISVFTRHTVRPGVHTALVVRTVPDAERHVYAVGDEDPAHGLRVFTDAAGLARFSVRPDAASDEIGRLVLVAEKDGRTTRHQVELRSALQATVEHPAPQPELAPALHPGATLRPGLSEEEALRLSHSDAFAGGYPLQPDVDSNPAAFQTWLRAVTSPLAVVEPRLRENPGVTHRRVGGSHFSDLDPGTEVSHTPATSSNWSGYERRQQLVFSEFTGGQALPRPVVHLSPPYDYIIGTWRVPAVAGTRNVTSYSSLWVGLDGDGTTDLVQAGTEQDAIQIWLPFIGNLNLASYYAWSEFLPQQPVEQIIGGLPVAAGDEIYTEVSMGNAGANPSLPGAFGRFVIINLTQQTSSYVTTARGTTSVGGSEAVWIMERPTVGGSLPQLADYGSVVMDRAVCRLANSAQRRGFESYLGGNNRELTMLNGTDTLSTVTAIDTNSMRFDWKAFS